MSALPKHEPLGTVEATEHRQQRGTTERIECPTCGKTFVGAAIVPAASGPVFAYDLKCHVITRYLYCDHCEKIYFWEQRCNHEGKQLGEVLLPFGTITKRASISAFLRAHPEAAGVAQS